MSSWGLRNHLERGVSSNDSKFVLVCAIGLLLVSALTSILPYFQRAYGRLGEEKRDLEIKGGMVLEKAHSLLKDHNPKPSILHGDLWVSLRL